MSEHFPLFEGYNCKQKPILSAFHKDDCSVSAQPGKRGKMEKKKKNAHRDLKQTFQCF